LSSTRAGPLLPRRTAQVRRRTCGTRIPATRRGLDLYRRRPDKAWSLTDGLSFVVMTDRGLTDALTGDHHVEQAGFRALLRST
jgi:hypothetical protein